MNLNVSNTNFLLGNFVIWFYQDDGINLQVKERIMELLKIGAKMACDKKLICNDFYNELNESGNFYKIQIRVFSCNKFKIKNH